MEEIQHSLLFCMDPYGNGIIPYNAHMKKNGAGFVSSTFGGLINL